VSVILSLLATAAADVFVSVDEVAALRAQGAVLIDARGDRAYRHGHLPGSAPLDWTTLRDNQQTGRLTDNTAQLQQALRAVGVSGSAPVIVYDDGLSGWGEAGRIWWTLAYLGHTDTHILDGGLSAWGAAGRPLTTDTAAAPAGDLVVRPDPERRAELDRVARTVEECQGGGGCGVVFWDTREAREYGGATPYGEARGGHLPGAVGLHYKALLDGQGRLRPEAELRAILGQSGITADQVIVPYCTGGVRSAFAAAVLEELGYPHVANYDGSMWEWSAEPERPLN
jgi:thiosulfate/3-mercaptopyruvate sulfurtransferase